MTIEKRLYQAISELEIIDCHEHLGDEAQRVNEKLDVLSLFSFGPYTGQDLALAGLNQESQKKLQDPSVPLADRWQQLEPYWQKIQYTSYSRAISLAVGRFYAPNEADGPGGQAPIHAGNLESISQAMADMNQPGIYKKILREELGFVI